MTQRVICPVSNPPAEDGQYIIYFGEAGGSDAAWYESEDDIWRLDPGMTEMIVGDFTHWEELPEFDQALVVGGIR